MNKYFFFILISLFFIGTIPSVHAHCPLCTAAVGAAAVTAKYYGLDSSIIGLLIGAFGISTGLWIGLKIKKYFKFQLFAVVLASFLLTVIPLLYLIDDTIYFPLLLLGPAGSVLNKVYWINKMLFGSVIGAIITLISYVTHLYIKKFNGKVLFPFQGVVLTLVFLFVSSLGLYFIFR